MQTNSILGIRIGNKSIARILAEVDEFFSKKKNQFYHIVNLNPDIFIIAYKDRKFRSIINNSETILIDGVGIKIASFLLGIPSGERMTGTDFMKDLIELAVKKNKKILFLGGRNNTAELTGKYFKNLFPNLIYIADSGASDIKTEKPDERQRILHKIEKFKPDILLVAYGPPYQEYWIDNNKNHLKGIVCIGVGGSFNFFAKYTIRAPRLIGLLGFEWLWRFIFEPKRLVTKLPNYIYFSALILKHLVKKYGHTRSF